MCSAGGGSVVRGGGGRLGGGGAWVVSVGGVGVGLGVVRQ